MFIISIEGPLAYSDASNTERLKLGQGPAPHGHFRLPDPGPLTQASELKAGTDHICSAVSSSKGNDVLGKMRTESPSSRITFPGPGLPPHPVTVERPVGLPWV